MTTSTHHDAELIPTAAELSMLRAFRQLTAEDQLRVQKHLSRVLNEARRSFRTQCSEEALRENRMTTPSATKRLKRR